MYWLELETTGEFGRSLKRMIRKGDEADQMAERGTKTFRSRPNAQPNFG